MQFFIFLVSSVTFHSDMAVSASTVSEMFFAFFLVFANLMLCVMDSQMLYYRARAERQWCPQREILGFPPRGHVIGVVSCRIMPSLSASP